MHQLQQPKLKMKPLLLSIPQLVERSQHHLQKPRQLLLAEECSRPSRTSLFISRDLQQFPRNPVRTSAVHANPGDLRNHAIPQIPHKLPRQLSRRISRIQQLVRNRNHLGAAVPIHRLEYLLKNGIRTVPISSRIWPTSSRGRPSSIGALAIA